MVSRKEETGSYVLGSVENTSVYPLKIQIATEKLAIFPAAAVKFANENPAEAGCAVSDWLAAVPRTLVGTTCESKPNENNGPEKVKIIGDKIHFFHDGKYDDTDTLTKAL